AAPIEEQLAHQHAPEQHRTRLAIRRKQDVLARHRGAYADRGGFLTEARRERAELSGSLQRYGLSVEHPRQQHVPIELDELVEIAAERRRVVGEPAVLVQVLRVANLEARDRAGGGFAGIVTCGLPY